MVVVQYSVMFALHKIGTNTEKVEESISKYSEEDEEEGNRVEEVEDEADLVSPSSVNNNSIDDGHSTHQRLL